MAKKKTVYHCSECGAQYPKWQGYCSQCGTWNSIEEEEIILTKGDKPTSTFTATSITASKPERKYALAWVTPSLTVYSVEDL